ncbi:MAG TPA: hypothetical protein VGO96_05510, partial [Pyrinomonadaceae bacterium]|jgi:tetratricopeptide (TPR) repeat protein|nr:hypothetical protein [Pyrinomonadaceae bacterium]
VLFDARRRKFRFYAVALWTLAAFASTLIVFPLYLVARLFIGKRVATPHPLEATTSHADTKADDAPARASISDGADEQSRDGLPEEIVAPSEETRAPLRWRRELALPLLYALALLSFGALRFYRDYHSFEAHLSRAANARLLNQRAAAIREYRAALRLSDDAHTHKLLAVQLAEDGQTEAALAELRAAERAGGDDDALLPYRIAQTLDALGRRAEADLEYQKLTQGSLCALPSPDALCAEASARVQQRQGELSQ